MERDTLIAFALLGIFLGAIPTLILIVNLIPKGKDIQKTGSLDPTKPTEHPPHVAEVLAKIEQMKTNPFSHVEDLQKAWGYHDKLLGEELPPFSIEELRKDQEEEKKQLQKIREEEQGRILEARLEIERLRKLKKSLTSPNYLEIPTEFARLQDMISDSLSQSKGSDSDRVKEAILSYKEYSSSIRKLGFGLISDEKTDKNTKSIIYTLLRLSYIPFSEKLTATLVKETISDKVHQLLIENEGGFLSDEGKVALVNPDSSIILFIDTLRACSPASLPDEFNIIDKVFGPKQEYLYTCRRLYRAKIWSKTGFTFPLSSSGIRPDIPEFETTFGLAHHTKDSIEKVDFAKSITMEDIIEKKYQTVNEQEFLESVSQKMLNLAGELWKRNFVWEGFDLGSDLRKRVDLEAFNRNVVYGLMQMIYLKNVKMDEYEYQHFTLMIENGKTFYIPSFEIDPKTMFILAACHHHQMINRIGLTIPLHRSFFLDKFIEDRFVNNPKLDDKYGNAMGVPMLSHGGKVVGPSRVSCPPDLMQDEFGREIAKRASRLCIESRLATALQYYSEYFDGFSTGIPVDGINMAIPAIYNYSKHTPFTQIDHFASLRIVYRFVLIKYVNQGDSNPQLKHHLNIIDDYENLNFLIEFHFSETLDNLTRLKKIYFMMNGSPTFPILTVITKENVSVPGFLIVHRITNAPKKEGEEAGKEGINFTFSSPGVFNYFVPGVEKMECQAISDILFVEEKFPLNQSKKPESRPVPY